MFFLSFCFCRCMHLIIAIKTNKASHKFCKLKRALCHAPSEATSLFYRKDGLPSRKSGSHMRKNPAFSTSDKGHFYIFTFIIWWWLWNMCGRTQSSGKCTATFFAVLFHLGWQAFCTATTWSDIYEPQGERKYWKQSAASLRNFRVKLMGFNIVLSDLRFCSPRDVIYELLCFGLVNSWGMKVASWFQMITSL